MRLTIRAVIDTGGPVTLVADGVFDEGGDPVATGTTMTLLLGGAICNNTRRYIRPVRRLPADAAILTGRL